MNAANPAGGTVGPEPALREGPIGRIESRLELLDAGIRSTVRRSRRISWLAWGFLFAAVAGLPLFVIGVFVAGVTSSGNASLLDTVAVGTTPAIVLFGLTVWQLWRGRRESLQYREGHPPPAEPSAPAPVPLGVSILTVQESQKQISRVRGELEISMIPIILGGITLFELVGDLVLQSLVSSSPQGPSALEISFVPVLPIVLIIPIVWILWRTARHWVDEYQRGLDVQVHQMISLEGEFLGRFASGSRGVP
jgi:hypothetical protein